VENKFGVLTRVTGLFSGRGYNIDTLNVGPTHDPKTSRMTIVVDASRANARQIATNLFKLINVIDVKLVSNEPYVSRDLALIKVRTDDAASYNAVAEICEKSQARIVDMGPKVAIVEIAAREEQVEEVIRQLGEIGIVELVRTGVVAMGRGTRIMDTDYEPPVFSPNGLSGQRFGV